MNTNKTPNQLADQVYRWSTAGIFLSILIFISSSAISSESALASYRTAESNQFITKNDVLLLARAFVGNGLEFRKPDLFKQAVASAERMTSTRSLTTTEIDAIIVNINSLEEYDKYIAERFENSNPIKVANEMIQKSLLKIEIMEKLQNLLFALLVISQIISAWLAFRAANRVRTIQTKLRQKQQD